MNIEILEPRIAPAAVLHYTDIDGDLVTVTASKGTTAQLAAICTFSNPNPDLTLPRTLQKIDFKADAATFAGTNLSVTVKHGPGLADGFANVGAIDALDTGGGPALSLGAINIAGDLGKIRAGAAAPAVKSLTVRSMGRLGTTTQAAGGNLESVLSGPLGALTVKGDIVDVYLTAASIGSVTIGGSLIGGDGNFSGNISTTGAGTAPGIGVVKIGGNIQGGAGHDSGGIDSKTNISSITIGGSLIGYVTNINTGRIRALGQIGAVRIGHGVFGGGDDSGQISSSGGIASVKIGGSLFGGAGDGSGAIKTGSLGRVTIGHDVLGGIGIDSGQISAVSMASVTIGGSLIGGEGTSSGSISAILALNGAVVGAVKIGHNVLGGTGGGSGTIDVYGSIASVTVGGSLIGGPANLSGVIRALLDNRDIGPIKIGHDVRGGSISNGASASVTGAILSSGRIASVTIGGSLISGFDLSTGDLSRSGVIFAENDIGALTIKGSLIGNEGNGNGVSLVQIAARGQHVPGATTDVAFGKISIGGRVDHAQILAGFTSTAGGFVGVNADAQIGAVRVGGDWIASSIAAGADNLGNDGVAGGSGLNADNVNFGNGNDAKIVEAGGDDAAIVSRIASITIGGQIVGTSNFVTDRFGFVAEEVAKFKVGGFKVTLNAGASNDGFIEIGPFNDVRIDEVLTP